MIQLNNQPPEARTNLDGRLDVIGSWLTIQGEGPFVGTPAVFVRLAGCQLQCPACDTRYTEGRYWREPEELLAEIEKIRPDGLVVLTGGEPFRQNIAPLAHKLWGRGYTVQIETNGGIYREDFPFSLVAVVCSPKGAIRKELRPHIAAWKYVVKAGSIDEADGLPISALDMPTRPARPEGSKAPVYIQPCDQNDPEANQRNLEAAKESCFRHGHRLCLQLHKILGLP